MAAAASTLVQHGRSLSENTRTMLARSIETKAREMSKLVSNVLDLTRVESGQLVLRRDWQSFDDLAGTAVRSLEDRLEAHLVELCIPPGLPLIFVDAALIVQVLYNLLENASKYTPAGSRVCVSAVTDGECLRMSVDDHGPGLPPGDPARLFDKFQRGNVEGNGMGAGLGLAISRAIRTWLSGPRITSGPLLPL